MFLRIFSFLFGFGLMVVGCTYLILYLNLVTIGYSMKDYFIFVARRFETYYVLIGLIIISLSIFIKGGRKYEFYL